MPFVPFTNQELCTLEDTFGRIEVATPEAVPPRRHRGETEPRTPWQAVFRVPSEPAALRFETAANGDKAMAKAQGLRDLAIDCIVALSRDGQDKVIATDDTPAGRKPVVDAWKAMQASGFPSAHIAASPQLVSLLGMGADEAGKG